MNRLIKELLINQSETAKCLYYKRLLSSSEISNYTGKSIPYAIKILNELIAKGYVQEKGYATSSGGRKPINYSINPEIGYLVSVALDQYALHMVVVDLNNHFRTPVMRHDIDLHDLEVDELVAHLRSFINNLDGFKSKIIGIGLTMPGFVDTVRGINFSFLKIEGDSLANYIQEQLLIPVFLENDSTAIALSEQKFGVAQHLKNVMVVNLGWGIGLGMILNGEIFRGNNGLAGEFSHLPLFKNGKLCSCGKHGCLETEASLIAITAAAKRGIEEGQVTTLVKYDEIDADMIIAEAIKGDVFSVKLISEAAYHIGEGLAILIHLMNPAAIVLSGKGSVIGKLWMAPIQQAINEHCIPMLTGYTEIMISNLTIKAQLIGGAALVVENFGKNFQAKLASISTIPAITDYSLENEEI
jgi:predicted NBD/HSP70 family sugar kinase